MTTTEKKKIDYSNSAVNLCYPANVRDTLAEIRSFKNTLIEVQAKINELIPAELSGQEAELQAKIENLTNEVKETIDIEGSFQDLTLGWYGIKQRKVSKSYNVEQFEHNYPLYAPAVIIKAVDTTKLNGLIKGGLITEDSLKDDGVITEKETFAYIVKVD